MTSRNLRRVGLMAASVAGLVGLTLGALQLPSEEAYVVRTAADPSEGPALVHEAIENVRGMERFRFTQRVSGASSALNPADGDVTGAADLSSDEGDLPKYQAATKLQGRNGADVSLEQVAVGEDLHVKLPQQQGFRKSDKKARKSTGKKAGGGSVDVVDPVMSLLEPVDDLAPSAFGAPSAPDADGIRTVSVTPGNGATLVLAIDDASHLVRRISYEKDGKTVAYALSDFGSSSIDIQAPGT